MSDDPKTRENETNRRLEAAIVGKATGLGEANVENIVDSMVKSGVDEELARRSVNQKAASIRPPGGESKG